MLKKISYLQTQKNYLLLYNQGMLKKECSRMQRLLKKRVEVLALQALQSKLNY